MFSGSLIEWLHHYKSLNSNHSSTAFFRVAHKKDKCLILAQEIGKFYREVFTGELVQNRNVFSSLIILIFLGFIGSESLARPVDCGQMPNLQNCINPPASSQAGQKKVDYFCPNGTKVKISQAEEQAIVYGFYPPECKGNCGPAANEVQCPNNWLVCGQTEPDCTNAPDVPGESPVDIGQAVSDCNTALGNVNHQCDLRTNSGTASIMSMGQVLMKSVSANPTAACGSMGTFATASQVALAAYDTQCQMAVSSCQAACAISGVRDPNLAAGLKQCSATATKAVPDYSVIAQMIQQSSQQATVCANLNAALTNPACLTNPLAPGCAGYSASDCSNPTNSGSSVCQCILHPTTCNGVASATNQSAVTGGGALGSTAGAGGGVGGGLGSDGLAAMLQDPANSSKYTADKLGLASASNGGGGGGGRGGGGDSGAKKPGAPGKVAESKSASMYGGLIAPNTGSTGSANSRGGYGPAVGNANGKGVLGSKVLSKNPDFNSFRPNIPYDPSRALAGRATGGPKEITGPELSNWQKVKNQFNQQGTSFISQ